MSNRSEGVFREFLKWESAGGILLISAALLALLMSNTPLRVFYDMLISTPVEVRVGALIIAKPLLLWINDGLMAIFFFLVGLELKREVLEGELSDPRNIVLPGIGAIGGMAVPALIYLFFNADDAFTRQGWAIPAATDIAFALGVLTLLGSRVPLSLKIFLTSLAIFDDIGAILIIAFFYTSEISTTALIVVSVCLALLVLMNRRGVDDLSPYIGIGIIMWIATLKSGVHATLAGVLLAMFIPLKSNRTPGKSPLKSLEHDLHPLVSFLILPIFAFANSGIDFTSMSADAVLHSVPIGIALGLFFGKQIGVFGLCWLAVVSGLIKLPRGTNFLHLYGISALCGIGFTMSLFIGSLSFEETGFDLFFDERLGIIVGSLASGLWGWLILHWSLKSDELGNEKDVAAQH